VIGEITRISTLTVLRYGGAAVAGKPNFTEVHAH